MVDISKLQQALSSTATANGLLLNSCYVQIVVNKGDRQQHSQQRDLAVLLESKMSETELAAEIIDQIGGLFKADEPDALKAEVADLRAQLERARKA
jgi:hypothetical protein